MKLATTTLVENNARSAQPMLRDYNAVGTQAVLTPGVCSSSCGAVVPVTSGTAVLESAQA